LVANDLRTSLASNYQNRLDCPVAVLAAPDEQEKNEMNDPRAIHVHDQLDAAAAETHRLFEQVAEFMLRDDRLDTRGDTHNFSMALFSRLFKESRPCVHLILNPSPQPIFVSVANKSINCRDCFTILIDLIRLGLVSLGSDCDLCGQPVPSNRFSEFTVNVGNVIMFGNRGMCCFDTRGLT